MNEWTVRKTLPQVILSQLYGFIFCMIASNALLGLPLYGGALYLCGRAVGVLASIFRKKERSSVPPYVRGWVVLIAFFLLSMSVALTGIYPSRIDNPAVWAVFGVTALNLTADYLTTRTIRQMEEDRKHRKGILLMGSLICLALSLLCVPALGMIIGWWKGFLLSGGFLIVILTKAYTLYRAENSDSVEMPVTDTPEDQEQDIQLTRIHRHFERIVMLLTTAIEMTLSAIYALLATESEHLIPATAIGIGCTILFAELARFLLKRSRDPKNPIRLLYSGLVIWLAGIVLCSFMLVRNEFHMVTVYLCLAVSSIGGTLCIHGLETIEDVMQGVSMLRGIRKPPEYDAYRNSNLKFSVLLGDVIALTGLSLYGVLNHPSFSNELHQPVMRFHPLMIIPLTLIILGTMLSLVFFPITSRYYTKFRYFRSLSESGVRNPALENQLVRVATEPYRQPLVTSLLIGIIRPFYRHTLVHPENIPASGEPLLMICNHGEIYGPIVCKVFLPVPVRAWTISHMMFDKKAVTAYVYENTFNKIEGWPQFFKKAVSRFIGGLSVTVMKQIESIPVYRDQPMKLRETIRMSIEALEAGDNLLIFPEQPSDRYARTGISEISPGFVMLAAAYRRKTQRDLNILPIYANKENRTISFGKVIQYNPANSFSEEQERLIRETTDQIDRMSAGEKL